MTTTAPALITCPVCQSQGDLLHHDIRACLVYSCGTCRHEWEIDPADVAVDHATAIRVTDKLTAHQGVAKVKHFGFDR